jgi:DNA-binding NarL/FixJ family response regulator
MKPIRILLGRMSPLLLDMLHNVVASNPDMAVVGHVGDADLLTTAKRTRADVILVGRQVNDEREQYGQLLLRRPRLKVLAIAHDGRTGSLYELRPRRVPLGQLSADALCRAIRRDWAKPAKRQRSPANGGNSLAGIQRIDQSRS